MILRVGGRMSVGSAARWIAFPCFNRDEGFQENKRKGNCHEQNPADKCACALVSQTVNDQEIAGDQHHDRANFGSCRGCGGIRKYTVCVALPIRRLSGCHGRYGADDEEDHAG